MLKKLLIYLSLLFSISLFIFIPGFKVKAANTYTLDDFNDYTTLITEENIQAYFDYHNIDRNIYDAYFILIDPNYYNGKPNFNKGSGTDYYNVRFFIFNYQDMLDGEIYIGTSTWDNKLSYALYYTLDRNYNIYPCTEYVIDFNKKFPTKTYFDPSYTNVRGFSILARGVDSTTLVEPTVIYTNVDLLYADGSIAFPSSKPKSYNVTFHLNGGNVLDKNIINDNKVGNKYEDYTTIIQANKIYDYITNMEFKKDGMDFKGLYYDEKLTLKLNLDQYSEITGDREFYVKFVYKDVEDFLKNTNFNTYTFDTNYEYAIISLNSKTNKDIYLGLNYIDYSLEIYKYLKVDNEYKQGSVNCLTPYYSKNNKYYYWLESPLDNDYEVLVLPKEKFKDNNYEFLLSDNAYISYTNDLTKVIIKNDDGQDIETNLESSYNYSQDALLNNENDIIDIFKKLAENKDNNVFSYFTQIWNYIKKSKLYTYLLTLIIGSLIILIIKVAKR